MKSRSTETPELSDVPVDPAAAVIRLRRCLEALASVGAEQQPLFPEQRLSPEAVAAEFDRAAMTVQRLAPDALTADETAAVERVSEKLLTLSSDGADFDADLWTEGAARASEHWRQVRELAASAVAALRSRP